MSMNKFRFIYLNFQIPESAFHGLKINKKDLYENTTIKERNLISKFIANMELLFILDEESLVTTKADTMEEIIILGVDLKTMPANLKDISLALQMAIPKPLVIIFKIKEEFAISMLAHGHEYKEAKGINRIHITDYNLKFIQSLSLNLAEELSLDSIWSELEDKITCYGFVKYFGEFRVYDKSKQTEIQALASEVEGIENEINNLKREQKSTTQFNKKVQLNDTIHKKNLYLTNRMEELKTWKS